MDDAQHRILAFLETVHPYDSLPRDELARVAGSFSRREFPAGAEIYHAGEPLQGIYLVKQGAVEVLDPSGDLVSLLGPRNSFGERGLLRDGTRRHHRPRRSRPASFCCCPAPSFAA